MSLRNTARAFPTMLRVAFSEAVAYRAEMLVWVLATTMPLIMLALWSAVARDAPIGRFGQAEFTAYFLVTFIVRQLTGSWTSWQMNFEVRQGTLAMRLLRPVHPVVGYATEILAALPLRILVSVPVALVMLAVVGPGQLPRDPVLWGMGLLALAGGWLLTFFVNVAIGCMVFFVDNSLKLMDVYLAFFFVFAGYLIPVELFPEQVRGVVDFLPFRYQIGLPVEVFTSAYGRAEAARMLLQQWGFVAAVGGFGLLLWRAGLRRFAAYGG